MTQTLARRLAEAADELAGVSESPRLDAELLLSHSLGISRSVLLTRLRERGEAPGFETLVQRRLACEPVAYILGEWEFFSLPLCVKRPILVPRPETEHLVEAVLDHIADAEAEILELCTGSGCVAVAVAHNAPNCRVSATDINPDALSLAARNVMRHALEERVTLLQGDLFAALPEPDARFEAICANPPYVEDGAWEELAPDIRAYEDPRALLAGPAGLDVVTRIVREAGRYLKPGGLLALEIGMGQYSDAAALLDGCGFVDIGRRRDLAGIDRIVTAHAPSRGRS